MIKLDNFINMMTGHFNNKEQFDNMQREGKTYPYAEHINTICNEKILNLPKDFNGKFVVEEKSSGQSTSEIDSCWTTSFQSCAVCPNPCKKTVFIKRLLSSR